MPRQRDIKLTLRLSESMASGHPPDVPAQLASGKGPGDHLTTAFLASTPAASAAGQGGIHGRRGGVNTGQHALISRHGPAQQTMSAQHRISPKKKARLVKLANAAQLQQPLHSTCLPRHGGSAAERWQDLRDNMKQLPAETNRPTQRRGTIAPT